MPPCYDAVYPATEKLRKEGQTGWTPRNGRPVETLPLSAATTRTETAVIADFDHCDLILKIEDGRLAFRNDGHSEIFGRFVDSVIHRAVSPDWRRFVLSTRY